MTMFLDFNLKMLLQDIYFNDSIDSGSLYEQPVITDH